MSVCCTTNADSVVLHDGARKLRALTCQATPDLAIIVPVNARGDLSKTLDLLADIAHYEGRLRFQIILVVNNFDPDNPPEQAMKTYRNWGVQTLSSATLDGNTGVPPALRARMLALPMARTVNCVFFDADCRIPDATACFNWYHQALCESAVMLAYTKVDYYNWPSHRFAMRVWLHVHHLWRAFKRICLQVPTPRGSSYGINRDLKRQLFEDGYLADETGLGRVVKAFGHQSMYTGNDDCKVLTDGRMFENAQAHKLFTRYAMRRLRINLVSMVVRPDAANHTGRKGESAHQYDEHGRLPD